MPGEKRRFKHLLVFVLLALLIHAGVVIPLLSLIISLQPSPEEHSPLQVDIWNRTLATDQEEEKTPKEELEEYEPIEEIPKGQVVTIDPSQNRQKPDKPRFLAEYDSKTDKETRSRIQAPGTGAGSTSPQVPGQGQDSQTIPGGMISELHGVGPLPSDLARADQGDFSADLRAPPSLENINLQPSMQAMTQAIAGSGLDSLKDVVDGDSTELNTAGWDYASFFNRVKKKVEQLWHPGVEYKKRDPYGNVYGFKDRITVLLVVLRSDGTLKHLYVMDPSGAPFLDDEAYTAVDHAAPFPNVPPGLRDKDDGLVKFTFHFIVEIGSQPIFRVRRYR